MNLRLERFFQNNQKTLGNLILWDEGTMLFACKTLELPWLDNQSFVSCIPTGTYQVVRHSSQKYRNVFRLENVPGRTGILIHGGNFTYQIKGCILVGIIHDDINNDGIMDVKHSGVALEALRHYIKGEDLIIQIQ